MVTPIDTLAFILRSNQVGGERLLQAVSPYLDADRVKYHSKQGNAEVATIEYNDENLTFYITDDYIKLYKGSISKAAIGNNVQSMTTRDLKDTIDGYSDLFHLPLDRASITRLDFGWNIITTQQPKCYYPYLGQLARFHRCTERHSLYYKQESGRKEIKFYDKRRECKNNVPTLFKEREVLRYEISYKNHVEQHLKTNDIIVSWLYDYDNTKKLTQTLYSLYKQISKNCDYMIDIDFTKGLKGIDQVGRLLYIENSGGIDNLLEQLDSAQRQGKIPRQQKSKIKEGLLSAISDSNHNSMIAKSELIAELDKKMLAESIAR